MFIYPPSCEILVLIAVKPVLVSDAADEHGATSKIWVSNRVFNPGVQTLVSKLGVGRPIWVSNLGLQPGCPTWVFVL